MDILNIFPCCKVMWATISTPTLIAQTGQTCKQKALIISKIQYMILSSNAIYNNKHQSKKLKLPSVKFFSLSPFLDKIFFKKKIYYYYYFFGGEEFSN